MITKSNKSKLSTIELRQTAKTLSLQNAGKHEFLTGEMKELLEKAAIITRFENLPLGSELKKQTDIVERQYHGLKKIYKFDKKQSDKTINKAEKEDDKITTIKK